MKRINHRTAVLAAVLGLTTAFGLVACGSDGADEPPATQVPSTETMDDTVTTEMMDDTVTTEMMDDTVTTEMMDDTVTTEMMDHTVTTP